MSHPTRESEEGRESDQGRDSSPARTRDGERSRRAFLQALAATGSVVAASARGTAVQDYGRSAAARDAWLYARQNADALQFSHNGVPYPATEAERPQFDARRDAIREVAGLEQSPARTDRWLVAPFVAGSPRYVDRPVFYPRPLGETLTWDDAGAVPEVTPAALAWFGLACVSWATALERRSGGEARYWAQVYGTVTQLSVRWALFPDQSNLRDERREDREDWPIALAARYDAATPADAATGATVAADRPDPSAYLAMLWFLSVLRAFAIRERFGFGQPEPLVEPAEVAEMADAVATVVVDEFSPVEVLQREGVRGLGVALAAMAWYGAGAGASRTERASCYANELADLVALLTDADGELVGADRQPAAQGVVGQGLVWASQLPGVERTELARLVLSYLVDALWDDAASTFGVVGSDHRITARDAGDVIAGLNAAHLLRIERAGDRFTGLFAGTVNRGRLQRAQLLESADPEAEFQPPFPAGAGGRFGEAPVYSAAVAYDADRDAWRTADDRFRAAPATYLACQSLWAGRRGDATYPGRGAPGVER